MEYIDNHVQTFRENEKKLRGMLLDLARAVANNKPSSTTSKKPRSPVEEHKEMVVVLERLVDPMILNQNAEENENSKKLIETVIKTEPLNSHEIENNIFDDENNESEDDFDYEDDKPLGADTILDEDISVDYSEEKSKCLILIIKLLQAYSIS